METMKKMLGNRQVAFGVVLVAAMVAWRYALDGME